MPSIKILSLSLQNKIAAGEVVERPASVVKELIENSIDALSAKIEIEIKHAGRKLIRVSDNGVGMDAEDALTAFERYATSKILDESDLFNIKTLGFRGEALSSISAVSKMHLSTALAKAADQSMGTCVSSIGGIINEVKPCLAIGTTIEVRDLFFNTPARKKFLKSDNTEDHQIIDVVTKEAISHYSISFALIMDRKTILDLPRASSPKERLIQIFGKELFDSLIEAESDYGWIKIKAFLSGGTRFMASKTDQYIFVNNRPVRDTGITHAVYKSYGDALTGNKHPVFFIFVNIDPQRVDFNVHPAKREVRFVDKGAVFSFINYSLSQVLKRELYYSEGLTKISADSEDVTETYTPHAGFSYSAHQQIAENIPLYFPDYPGNIPYIYLGDTFVAITGKDGLTIIDYHAAHERINYEKLLKKADIPIYTPLFPQNIRLAPAKYRTILKNLDILNELGLSIDDFGHETVILRALPSFLDGADLSSLISDIADSLANKQEAVNLDASERLGSARKIFAATIACHRSIRGQSEVPDSRGIASLLKELSATDNPSYCPHGRPTKITISLSEIKKMFKK